MTAPHEARAITFCLPAAVMPRPAQEDSNVLVISRKRDQGVRIGDAIVQVVKIRGGRVTLGFTAPDEVRISRAEVDGRPAREPQPEPAHEA